ncbi:MAG: SRPBCC family protein [Longimicrobiales bacterium]
MKQQVTDQVVVERRISARPQTVFSYFTDRDKWLTWQGVDADIDPRPGGMFRMNVRGDGWAAGRFVTVDPHHTIVFTWGWEGDDSPVPPGSSTVKITLSADGTDATVLRLVHSGLPLPALSAHRQGWNHYLDRLAVRVGGGDPGPDATAAAPPT